MFRVDNRTKKLLNSQKTFDGRALTKVVSFFQKYFINFIRQLQKLYRVELLPQKGVNSHEQIQFQTWLKPYLEQVIIDGFSEMELLITNIIEE